MSRICLHIKLELLEDLLFSSGWGQFGISHTEPILDREGRPFMPGSTLKGLMRESIENYLCWTGHEDSSQIKWLFASPDGSPHFSRRLIFQDLTLDPACADWSATRKRSQIKNDALHSLSNISCVAAGTCFYGMIQCDDQDKELLESGLHGIQWAGSMRGRGMGRVHFSVCGITKLPQAPDIAESHWLRYHLRIDTPMIVPKSAHGEHFIHSRSYLPGSAVRGMVMDRLSQNSPDSLRSFLTPLLHQVQFCNAFPTVQGIESIPTPKGFYADKQQTCFYSVLREEVRPGHKRAELGSFCYLKNDTIYHFSPSIEQRVRTSRHNGSVIFAQAIGSGTELVGYIHLQDPTLAPLVASAFYGQLQFGTFRYAGNGQCTLVSLDTREPDHFRYGYGPQDAIGNEVFMMLLSGTTMLRHGQSGGLDPKELATALEVPEVVIHRCATSVTEYGGYNNHWRANLPVSVMYSPGSIFRLSFPQGAPTWQSLHRLQRTGLGLRTAEGFGQILFLKDFSQLLRSQRSEATRKERQQSARFRAIRCAWLLDTPMNGEASGSSLRDLQKIGQRIMAGDPHAESELWDYLIHNDETRMKKRVQQQKSFAAIRQVLEQPLGKTLHCPDYPDDPLERVRLMVDWIEVISRKGY